MVQILITDGSTQIVLGKKMEVKTITANTIDVSKLSKGIYVIKLRSDIDQEFTTKFIKE